MSNVRQMMRAIKHACTHSQGGKLASRTNGLRAIRRFEKVNGCKFNPTNPTHLMLIAGTAHHEVFFRKVRRIFKNA